MIYISSKRQERIEKLSVMLARLYAHEHPDITACACSGLSCVNRGCHHWWEDFLRMSQSGFNKMLSLYLVATE